jgi:uncharacterized protein YdhG (YjbR/CyaY superfamily)
MPDKPQTVDAYLDAQPDDVRAVLEEVRAALHAGLPGAEERMRYDMPAVMLDGRYALHFAGWKRHVGIYPVAHLDGPLEDEVAPYRSEKDGLKFPHGKPIPYDLLTRLAAELRRLRLDAAA